MPSSHIALHYGDDIYTTTNRRSLLVNQTTKLTIYQPQNWSTSLSQHFQSPSAYPTFSQRSVLSCPASTCPLPPRNEPAQEKSAPEREGCICMLQSHNTATDQSDLRREIGQGSERELGMWGQSSSDAGWEKTSASACQTLCSSQEPALHCMRGEAQISNEVSLWEYWVTS